MYRKTVLDNGIKVISEQIDHVRSVSMGVWVGCGSRHENEDINGTAHFIEHMLFKGTESRSAFDIASEVDSVGGIMNAFTGKELTAFYVKVPDYHLPLSIELLADIFSRSLFDPQEVEKEKSVVQQEIHMVEDTPDEYIHDFFERIFWNRHPLGLPVLGTKESVQGFTREALLEFFHKKYRGNHLVLTAAGRLEHERLVEMVRGAFGIMEGYKEKVQAPLPIPMSRRACIERDLGQAHLIIGTPAPSNVDPRRFAGILMNTVLGGSMSSRLFQEIREKRGLAYAIRSYIVSYRDVGMLNIYVAASREKVKDVIGLILEEMRRMKREHLTDREMQLAKELIKGNLLLGLESTDNRMSKLATNEIYYGRHISYEEIVRHIDAVQKEDIRALTAELFDASALSLAALGDVSEKDLEGAAHL
ncbi:MAG TPA: pitrilysin family protein [Syntrophales bacterium]|nr:pitrilysin family protein [Syntrophales bacterium]HOX94575.1 pitrilysin family protein [Syntrophales bacterium]HPI57684.1 pitrilysin family protein [Syntrophales bacterium]HPN23917.1 pitrilysin family protein [Syntrophales bacterium]HQM28195.1 pitrilysin family protein [Syntrophales bacterium]